MRRVIAVALAALLIVALGVSAAEASHGTAANVALGLAAFAVFHQLVAPVFHPWIYTDTYVVQTAPVVSARPIVYYPPAVVYPVPGQYVTAAPTAPPPHPTVVYYPHGRYELRGDGIREPYVWVWVPNPPPPPPPPAPTR